MGNGWRCRPGSHYPRLGRQWSGCTQSDRRTASSNGPVRLVRFTPRNDLLLSVGDGGQVFLWDVASKSVAREWMIDKSLAYSAAISPDGRWLATGTNEGRVFVYDLDLMLVDQMPATNAGEQI